MKDIDGLWNCNNMIDFSGIGIPTSLDLEKYVTHQSRTDGHLVGIRKYSRLGFLARSMLWKPYHFKIRRLFRDDFIGTHIGRWLRRYCKKGDIVLDVGCGNMRLQRYVPESAFYYALDISVDEWNLKRISKIRNASFALASVTDIPLDDAIVDIAISMEMLILLESSELTSDCDRAIEEMHRVLKPGGLLFTSIPNHFGHKYQTKGVPEAHCSSWTYEQLVDLMRLHNFSLVEGLMVGKWIHLPLWLTKKNFYLPYSSANEFYNTNFLYVFRCIE